MSRYKQASSTPAASWFQILAIAIPLVTTTLTIGAAAWQFSVTNSRADQVRFVDAAQATAQETSVMLDDGYTALDKLIGSSGESGWKPFSASAWRNYTDFRRSWHQQLIAEHFKLSRYFGKDLADQIVHIDEIDLHPVDNLSSQSPCTPPGDKTNFDIEKLADQAECTTRIIAVQRDAIEEATKDKKVGEMLDAMSQQRAEEEFAGNLLASYDRARVTYLRALNERLTQLGQPQVKVMPAASR